ncbi:hypothetical protein BGW36DRAFT_414274 [Talaromyces proteolyticus]|uniref:Ketoreductase domain-containing protein n=1 Tax=Talaromyces proteolyticus TaxID=1131652 RepID=A0AAD4L5G3_9EURO|nr:uncharacterized protein BGW36DRAFT_414274 [Talaromyces proteolyticus]KAH8703917.1 hypothetical protein BGW36DRAFT_414274 [Talaromyces proteolyticus]
MAGKLTWLVTGCSSGLGEALALAILAAGDNVIATARSGQDSAFERLAPLKEVGIAIMEINVTAPVDVLNAKVKEAWSITGQIDVLINNAAYIDAGVIEEIDEPFITNALRNNVFGPLNLTRALLPYMRVCQSGTILFMSSVGAYYGAPGASAYSGSKGLLEGLVPNLALEIQPFGLRTCLVTPGYYRTQVIRPGNILYRAPNHLPEYAEMNKLIEAGCNAADGNQPGDPRKAAALIVEAVQGEGRCANKQLPERLPLGPDAFKAIRANCEAKLKICDEWESSRVGLEGI